MAPCSSLSHTAYVHRAESPRRLIKYVKGIDVHMQAMRLVSAHDDQAHFVLAGGSFHGHTRLQLNELSGLPQKLGIADRVTFVRPSRSRLSQNSCERVLSSCCRAEQKALVRYSSRRARGYRDEISRSAG